MSPRTDAPLRFCDQRYAEKVPIPEAGEFLIGDYTDEGTIGGDGEFRVTLIELHDDRRWSLYPHLEVYGEGVGALSSGRRWAPRRSRPGEQPRRVRPLATGNRLGRPL